MTPWQRVGAGADASHRAMQAGTAEGAEVGVGAELAAAVRMHYRPEGGRRATALVSASTARRAVMWSAMEYPTIRLVQASLIAHRYSLPCVVGCSVMSVSHNRSGAGRWSAPSGPPGSARIWAGARQHRADRTLMVRPGRRPYRVTTSNARQCAPACNGRQINAKASGPVVARVRPAVCQSSNRTGRHDCQS